MVAGGGASVVYSDAIAAHGFAHELANYGEYSGAPSEGQTYEYAKTILDLMTRGTPREDGKILIIGGGIANFTNVAATFKGKFCFIGMRKVGEREVKGLWQGRAQPYMPTRPRGFPAVSRMEAFSLMPRLSRAPRCDRPLYPLMRPRRGC